MHNLSRNAFSLKEEPTLNDFGDLFQTVDRPAKKDQCQSYMNLPTLDNISSSNVAAKKSKGVRRKKADEEKKKSTKLESTESINEENSTSTNNSESTTNSGEAAQLSVHISGLQQVLLEEFASQAAHSLAHGRKAVQMQLGEL